MVVKQHNISSVIVTHRTQNTHARHTCCLKRYTTGQGWKVTSKNLGLFGFFKQESCAIAKTTARCALYIAALKILESPHAPLSPKFLWPFAWSEPANVPAKFEVHSFKRS